MIAIAVNESPQVGLIVAEALVLGVIGLAAFVVRCRDASAIDRARLQWAGWGVVVAAGIACVVGLMHALVGWPDAVFRTAVRVFLLTVSVSVVSCFRAGITGDPPTWFAT